MKKFLTALLFVVLGVSSAFASPMDYKIDASGTNVTFSVFTSSTGWIGVWRVPTTTTLQLIRPTQLVDPVSGQVFGTFDSQSVLASFSRPAMNGPGTVSTTNSSGNVTGTGTLFSTWVTVGEQLTIDTVTRTITAVVDNTHLTTSGAFAWHIYSGTYGVTAIPSFFNVDANGRVVVANNQGGIDFTASSDVSTQKLRFFDNSGTLLASFDAAGRYSVGNTFITGTGIRASGDNPFKAFAGDGDSYIDSVGDKVGFWGNLGTGTEGSSGHEASALRGTAWSSTSSYAVGVLAEASNGNSGLFRSLNTANASPTLVLRDATVPQATGTKMLDIQSSSASSVASITKEGDATVHNLNVTGIASGITVSPANHAASHASGGGDPVTLAESQITNLTSDLAATVLTVKGGTGLTASGSTGNILKSNGTSWTTSSVWSGSVIGVASGGTSLSSLTANNVVLGNGASAPNFVAPSASGNILTSNGTTWTSTPPAGASSPNASGTVIGLDPLFWNWTSPLSLDRFTDTNGVQLSSHTPDVGPGWTVSVNPTEWTIQSNGLSRTASVIHHASVNVGQSDMMVCANVSSLQNIVSMLVRRQDTGNYWELFFDYTNQAWQLDKVTGSVDNNQGPLLAGTTGTVCLSAIGNVITGRSPLGATYSVTDAALNTQTSAGLIVDGFSSTASTLDNWIVVGPNASPVDTITGTGTGAVVHSSSPSIITPTIASFTNSTHTHQNAAGGGTLDTAAIASGTLAAARMPALTGDLTTTTGAVATTLATVNSNVGSFGSATQAGTFTVNGKGLVTAASNTTIAVPESAVTGLTTDLGLKAPLATPTFSGNVITFVGSGSQITITGPVAGFWGTLNAATSGTLGSESAGIRGSSWSTTATYTTGIFGESRAGFSGLFRSLDPANTASTVVLQDATTPQAAGTKLLDVQSSAGSSVASITKEGYAVVSTINKLTLTPPATSATLTISDGKTLSATDNATVSGTNTGDQTTVSGNSGTATALQTARAINGVNFDGTANITVPAAASTVTGTTLASGVTASSLTSFGSSPTLTTPTLGVATATTINKVTITGPATSATLTIADGKTLTASNTATVSGTNTGDQTITLTGDSSGSGTGSFATTLATVNSNVGSFGSATQAGTFTVNGKGLITAASNTTIAVPESAVTSLTTDLTAKLNATGTTTGATSQAQAFTNGLSTVATTGLVGIGMTPTQMLDITAPSALVAINAIGTQPAAVGGSSNGTSAPNIVTIVGATGGDTSSTTTNKTGGVGGALSFTGGVGGQQTGVATGTFPGGGTGGFFLGVGGVGGASTAVTGTGKGGSGGPADVRGGIGGASASSLGGIGGTATVVGGVGGVSTAAAASGKGGLASISGGIGGDNANAGGTTGGGGGVTIVGGVYGNPSNGAASGTAGTISIGLTSTAAVIIQSPTIADFTNSTHTHQNAAGGGTLDTAAIASGTLAAARMPALTGDLTTTTGAVATTLATVNSNVGSFGSTTAIPVFTVNGKGLLTAASTAVVVAPASTLTGSTLASGVTGSSLTSFGTSPVIITPTIASFTNSTHTHQNAAGGGTLDAAAVTTGTFASGRIPTLNQSTTGSAATLTTPRAINGVNFDGSAAITVPVANVVDVTLAAQAASLGTTNLIASIPADGVYRISWSSVITQAATTSSTNVVTIGWNNGTAKTTLNHSLSGGSPTNAADASNTVGSEMSGAIVVTCLSTTALTYATTYSSTGATPLQYALRVHVERLN